MKKVAPTQEGARLEKARKQAATKKNALKQRARQPKVAREKARLERVERQIAGFAAEQPNMPCAFFSYCRDDEKFALKLAEDLKKVGANVWIDRLDIEPGDPWDSSVEAAVTRAPRMLVVLSPVSVVSDNVRDEVSFALNRQKRVIPVLYRDCDVPFRLARLQHIDFRTNYERGLKALIRALRVEQQGEVTAQITVPATVTLSSVSDAYYGHTTHVSGIQEKTDPGTPERMATDSDLERQRIAAEYARLDEERQHIEAEQARLDEKRKQAEIDRRTLEVQHARLEQECQGPGTEQTRLSEDRVHTTAERARPDRQKHERNRRP